MQLLKRDIPFHKEFQLVVIGDAHVGDPLSDLKLLEKTIKYVEDTPHCYLILNGDLMNNALKHSKSDSYEASMTIAQQQDYLVEKLMPVRDKILAMTTGNHERRTMLSAGVNPLRYVATTLGIPDRLIDHGFLLELTTLNETSGLKENTYVVYGIHGGHGGGRRAGATANALEDMSKVVANADLYIHSHTHTPITYSDVIFIYGTRNKTLVEKHRFFFNGNAFLKYGGYAEEKGFKPVDRTPYVLVVRQSISELRTKRLLTDIMRI